MKEDKAVVINELVPLNEEDLENGLFLCLFGIDKIPPHLGLVANGKYYSSSAKGGRIAENVDLIIRRVNQSKIPTLFIKIDTTINENKLTESFSNYPKLRKQETCLLPIKDYFGSIDIDTKTANYVYQLIPLLREVGVVGNSYSLYYSPESFTLKVYTKEDITNRILKLQETC